MFRDIGSWQLVIADSWSRPSCSSNSFVWLLIFYDYASPVATSLFRIDSFFVRVKSLICNCTLFASIKFYWSLQLVSKWRKVQDKRNTVNDIHAVTRRPLAADNTERWYRLRRLVSDPRERRFLAKRDRCCLQSRTYLREACWLASNRNSRIVWLMVQLCRVQCSLQFSRQMCQVWLVRRHKTVHRQLLVARQIGHHLLLVMREPGSVKHHRRRFCQSLRIIGSMQALHFCRLLVHVVRWRMPWKACWKFSVNKCSSAAAVLLLVLFLWEIF